MEHGNLIIYTSDLFSPFGGPVYWFGWPNTGVEVKYQWFYNASIYFEMA